MILDGLMFSTSVFAQETPQKNTQLSANLLIPSVEYKLNTGEKTALDLLLGTGCAYRKTNGNSGYAVSRTFRLNTDCIIT